LSDLAPELHGNGRKMDLKLGCQSPQILKLDYQWTLINFEINLRRIQWMFDWGLYNKIKAGTLDNNFDVVELAVCHMRIREKCPSICSVRRTAEDPDGTVDWTRSSDSVNLATGDLCAAICTGRCDSCSARAWYYRGHEKFGGGVDRADLIVPTCSVTWPCDPRRGCRRLLRSRHAIGRFTTSSRVVESN
jgi:hypothetical protein